MSPESADFQGDVQKEQQRLDALDSKLDRKIDVGDNSGELTETYIGRVNDMQGRIRDIHKKIGVQKDMQAPHWQKLEKVTMEVQKKLLEKLEAIDSENIETTRDTFRSSIDEFLQTLESADTESEVATEEPTKTEEILRDMGLGELDNFAELVEKAEQHYSPEQIRSAYADVQMIQQLPKEIRMELFGVDQISMGQVAGLLVNGTFEKSPYANAVSKVRMVREVAYDRQSMTDKEISELMQREQRQYEILSEETRNSEYGLYDYMTGKVDTENESIKMTVKQIKHIRAIIKELQDKKQPYATLVVQMDAALALGASEKSRASGNKQEADRILTKLVEIHGSDEVKGATDKEFLARVSQSNKDLQDRNQLTEAEKKLADGDTIGALRDAVKEQQSIVTSADIMDQVQAKQTFEVMSQQSASARWKKMPRFNGRKQDNLANTTIAKLDFRYGSPIEVLLTPKAKAALDNIPEDAEPILLKKVESFHIARKSGRYGYTYFTKAPYNFLLQDYHIGYIQNGEVIQHGGSQVDVDNHEHGDFIERQMTNQRGFSVDHYASPDPLRYVNGQKYNKKLITVRTESGATAEGVTISNGANKVINKRPPKGYTIVLKRIPKSIQLSTQYDKPKRMHNRVKHNYHRNVLFADMIREEDLAYAKVEDGQLVTTDVNGENQTELSMQEVEKDRTEKSRDVLRVLHQDPSITYTKRMASTLNQTVNNMQSMLSAADAGSAREAFVEFAKTEAQQTLNLLENPETKTELLKAKQQLQVLKSADLGVALGSVEKEIDAQIDAIDQFVALIESDRVQHVLDSIVDASKFSEDSWENWFTNEFPQLLITIGVAVAVTAVVIASMGTATPFVIAAGSALGSVIGSEIAAEAVYLGHQAFGDGTFSQRSRLGSFAAGEKIYNRETGQYEEQTFAENIANPYAKQFAFTFVTTYATVGLGTYAGGKLSDVLSNSRVVEKIAEKSDIMRVVTRQLARLNAHPEILERAPGLREALKRAGVNFAREFGDELGDEAEEEVLTRLLNNLSGALSAVEGVDSQLGWGNVAAFLVVAIKATKVSKGTMSYNVPPGSSAADVEAISSNKAEQLRDQGAIVTDLGKGVLSVSYAEVDAEGNPTGKFEKVHLQPIEKTEVEEADGSTDEESSDSEGQGTEVESDVDPNATNVDVPVGDINQHRNIMSGPAVVSADPQLQVSVEEGSNSSLQEGLESDMHAMETQVDGYAEADTGSEQSPEVRRDVTRNIDDLQADVRDRLQEIGVLSVSDSERGLSIEKIGEGAEGTAYALRAEGYDYQRDDAGQRTESELPILVETEKQFLVKTSKKEGEAARESLGRESSMLKRINTTELRNNMEVGVRAALKNAGEADLQRALSVIENADVTRDPNDVLSEAITEGLSNPTSDNVAAAVRIAHQASMKSAPQLFDVQSEQYVVSEFLEGGVDGQDYMEVILDAPENVRMELGLRYIQAIRGVTESGITHQDVKPANFIVQKDGTVKVIDTGVAIKRNEGVDITELSKASGTPAYIATEQVRKQVHRNTDVYGVGSIVFQLFSKKGVLPINAVMMNNPDRSGRLIQRHGKVMAMLHTVAGMKQSDIELAVQQNIDDPAMQDLLIDMLHVDPTKRIPIEEAEMRLEQMLKGTDREAAQRALAHSVQHRRQQGVDTQLEVDVTSETRVDGEVDAEQMDVLQAAKAGDAETVKKYAAENDIDDGTRAALASELLGRDIIQGSQEWDVLFAAHEVGEGETGADGSPAGIDNYTDEQKFRKGRRLMENQVFNRAEAQLLLDAGLAGLYRHKKANQKKRIEVSVESVTELRLEGNLNKGKATPVTVQLEGRNGVEGYQVVAKTGEGMYKVQNEEGHSFICSVDQLTIVEEASPNTVVDTAEKVEEQEFSDWQPVTVNGESGYVIHSKLSSGRYSVSFIRKSGGSGTKVVDVSELQIDENADQQILQKIYSAFEVSPANFTETVSLDIGTPVQRRRSDGRLEDGWEIKRAETIYQMEKEGEVAIVSNSGKKRYEDMGYKATPIEGYIITDRDGTKRPVPAEELHAANPDLVEHAVQQNTDTVVQEQSPLGTVDAAQRSDPKMYDELHVDDVRTPQQELPRRDRAPSTPEQIYESLEERGIQNPARKLAAYRAIMNDSSTINTSSAESAKAAIEAEFERAGIPNVGNVLIAVDQLRARVHESVGTSEISNAELAQFQPEPATSNELMVTKDREKFYVVSLDGQETLVRGTITNIEQKGDTKLFRMEGTRLDGTPFVKICEESGRHRNGLPMVPDIQTVMQESVQSYLTSQGMDASLRELEVDPEIAEMVQEEQEAVRRRAEISNKVMESLPPVPPGHTRIFRSIEGEYRKKIPLTRAERQQYNSLHQQFVEGKLSEDNVARYDELRFRNTPEMGSDELLHVLQSYGAENTGYTLLYADVNLNNRSDITIERRGLHTGNFYVPPPGSVDWKTVPAHESQQQTLTPHEEALRDIDRRLESGKEVIVGVARRDGSVSEGYQILSKADDGKYEVVKVDEQGNVKRGFVDGSRLRQL